MSEKVASCCNKDVIHVYKKFSGVFVREMSEHAIHCMGKGGRGVGEAKKHYAWLK